MRNVEMTRKTSETRLNLKLELDGMGRAEIATGCGFLDHMLSLFASHSRCDLSVSCIGDTFVDFHHTVEDIGIVLGAAIKKALGDKSGITRYGSILLPMDESLILVSLDLSGRSYISFNLELTTQRVGEFDTELVEEFFTALVREAGMTLHIKQLDGKNTHHIIEGTFKAFARALRQAISEDSSLAGEIPSTKGVI